MNLTRGDHVRWGHGESDCTTIIASMVHPGQNAELMEFTLASDKRVSMTGDHLAVTKSGDLVPAGQLSKGDYMDVNDDEIVGIRTTRDQAAFPMTTNGRLLVNDVVVSTQTKQVNMCMHHAVEKFMAFLDSKHRSGPMPSSEILAFL